MEIEHSFQTAQDRLHGQDNKGLFNCSMGENGKNRQLAVGMEYSEPTLVLWMMPLYYLQAVIYSCGFWKSPVDLPLLALVA